MERLMRDFPMYEPTNENLNYIVKLKRNYRSHEKIIHIPNHLFYENELQVGIYSKIIMRRTKQYDF